MGISTISNLALRRERSEDSPVSIPNGDKHDFKPPRLGAVVHGRTQFQSPMGISTISNDPHRPEDVLKSEFQSPMGISTISNVTHSGLW